MVIAFPSAPQNPATPSALCSPGNKTARHRNRPPWALATLRTSPKPLHRQHAHSRTQGNIAGTSDSGPPFADRAIAADAAAGAAADVGTHQALQRTLISVVSFACYASDVVGSEWAKSRRHCAFPLVAMTQIDWALRRGMTVHSVGTGRKCVDTEGHMGVRTVRLVASGARARWDLWTWAIGP